MLLLLFIHKHNVLPFFFLFYSSSPPTIIFSWTVTDYETTCRQMGYKGGRYVQWMDRVNSSSSRPLLLENPRCYPGGSSLFQCDWNSRRVGAGVCGKRVRRFNSALHLFLVAFPHRPSHRQATELYQSSPSPCALCYKDTLGRSDRIRSSVVLNNNTYYKYSDVSSINRLVPMKYGPSGLCGFVPWKTTALV